VSAFYYKQNRFVLLPFEAHAPPERQPRARRDLHATAAMPPRRFSRRQRVTMPVANAISSPYVVATKTTNASSPPPSSARAHA